MDFHKIIKNYSNVFWDFDGVIKESVDVKKKAFITLFSRYGHNVTKKIAEHHYDNGGISRYEKFPLYLGWSNEAVNDEKINYLDKQFRLIVVSDVINSNWVPGADLFLKKNEYQQKFYLVTATPQNEIEEIINHLGMRSSFKKIYGSPLSKLSAISTIIKEDSLKFCDCIMVGDSISDHEAAQKNGISFILRRHKKNQKYAKKYIGNVINNFIKSN